MKTRLALLVAAVLGGSALAQTEGKPAEPTAPAPTPAEAPRKLAVGTEGFFTPGLLAQLWAGVDWPTSGEVTSTFKLRRIELSAKGEVLPGRVSYLVVFDPARVLEAASVAAPVTNGTPADPSRPETVTTRQPQTNLSMLQDAFMTYQTEYADLAVGQFKIPLSYEAVAISSGKLALADRSSVGRFFGDKRDLGLRASKTFKKFGYTFAIFDGAGQNTLDTNNAKDLALRLELSPMEGLTLAGVAYSTVGHREQAGTKDRWEGDLRFERGPVQLLGEVFVGRDVVAGGALSHTLGFSALAGWAVTETISPALRLSRLDPNLDRPLDLATDKLDQYWMVEAGCSYLVKKHEVKLQAWYGRTQNAHKAAVDQVLLTTQLWF